MNRDDALKQKASTLTLPGVEQALPGRDDALLPPCQHAIFKRSLLPPWPEGYEQVAFGMGCFWGAERLFWREAKLWLSCVGYAGGITPNPSYTEVCSGATGHAEVVLLVYNPEECSFSELLSLFWRSHDPTQGMRQGNDVGTQYRSAIYWQNDAQRELALSSRDSYADALGAQGFAPITTEIKALEHFYYAEETHQQYLAHNPNGYCGLKGTGVVATP
ncbi:peptide-methionine (S)-S-oxide reductase MsrA [Agaribacterium haliotis]|uniref:peptide-methionine (S)-S-oxide reductase MsrA n=1 Tax=Agaribacterium haliotis TaxID=2013869 RepID=UPI000BB56B89|nr:peptide-methionine (S)-S-oxide reductase MsrA [Agaribacterium haliotis]